jgi:hypothetical protein
MFIDQWPLHTLVWLVVRARVYMFRTVCQRVIDPPRSQRNNKGIDELLICLLAVKWEVTISHKTLNIHLPKLL